MRRRDAQGGRRWAEEPAMKTVRLGIIGVGVMGGIHARHVLEGRVPRCTLTAVCDIDPARLVPFERQHPDVACFADSRALIRSGAVDAVLIATPHYAHTTIGRDALEQGLHVLVEKPISVHKADCERLIAAHTRRRQVFAAMFNQRTDPHYRAVKRLIDDGELGRLVRLQWTITDWFRTQAYYRADAWRATWRGEGGGVLLNQSPHQLDLLQWLCGMPTAVRAWCGLGKHHDIEVEDEVTAYLEYSGGATGVFITSTGEAPGTNRLEICGERGKVVVEDGAVRFTRNEVPAPRFSRTARDGYAKPATWDVTIPVDGTGGQHVEIMANFAAAILDGAALIAPAREGLRSVELANAMLYSSLTGATVTLPLDGARFARRLAQLVRASRPKKDGARRRRR
jgi:predicted dehydrogenase